MEHRFKIKNPIWENAGLTEPPVIRGPTCPEPHLVMRQFEIGEGPWDNDLEKISCVIFGQDPYPDNGMAIGRAFAINTGFPLQKSLINIICELFRQFSVKKEDVPDFDSTLSHWVEQGVFLLNTALTCEPGNPNSHMRLWADFTKSVIRKLGEPSRRPRVFMLWGRKAQDLAIYIDSCHCVLKCPHPVAAFTNNGHFVTANNFLVEVGRDPIMWLSLKSEKLKKAVLDKMPPDIKKILDEKMAKMRKLESDIANLTIQKNDLKSLSDTVTKYISNSEKFGEHLGELDNVFEAISDDLCTIESNEIKEKIEGMNQLIGYLYEDINELTELVQKHSERTRKAN